MAAEKANSNSSIILTSQHLQNLISLARDSLPNECCALLVGKNNASANIEGDLKESNIFVNDIIVMRNSDMSTVTFSIDPQELIDAYQVVEKSKSCVVGIFHSHPTSRPIPSMTDRKYMEINPIVWLIYSPARNEFKAYIFEEGKIKGISLSVVTV